MDVHSWKSTVYTFSPIWKTPLAVDDMNIVTDKGGMAFTRAGSSTFVQSCYDPSLNSVHLKVIYDTDGVDSWLGLVFRDSKECAMTPTNGGSSELIVIQDGNSAFHGELNPSIKTFKTTSSISDSLVPLEDIAEYSHVEVLADDNSVILQFSKVMKDGSSAPDALYMNYAYGSSPEFGIHASRGCFEVTSFPTCTMYKNVENLAGMEDSSAASFPSVMYAFVALAASFSLHLLSMLHLNW